ncbi:MAG: TIGR01777 family oxidoreductase [Gemmatimonadetes bacterium]|nr:TIGR01777 family oxidoreductase [Gemmatimonadota bacterium]
MRVAITGSSGFIGSTLCAELTRAGHEVTRVVRREPRTTGRFVQWDPAAGRIDAGGLEKHDAVIHLAGESLAALWTPERKRRIVESRVKGTTLLATTLAGLKQPPGVLISSSAVGYYGARPPNEPITEEATPGTGFLAETAVRWENSASPAEEAGIRTIRTRTGLVLSPDGGPLAVMLIPFRLGLGGVIGSGKQTWPWIALEDVVHAMLFLIDRPDISGAVNLVAPDAVDNAAFTAALARALNRPALLRIPAFAMRLSPGGMADEMFLNGACVVPAKLIATGYAFRQPELLPALRAMLN